MSPSCLLAEKVLQPLADDLMPKGMALGDFQSDEISFKVCTSYKPIFQECWCVWLHMVLLHCKIPSLLLKICQFKMCFRKKKFNDLTKFWYYSTYM